MIFSVRNIIFWDVFNKKIQISNKLKYNIMLTITQLKKSLKLKW